MSIGTGSLTINPTPAVDSTTYRGMPDLVAASRVTGIDTPSSLMPSSPTTPTARDGEVISVRPVTPVIINTGTTSVSCPLDNVTFTRASAV